ncbi:unnamed protein product [Adineta steineri]|uniref:Uncharacterized protein n=1 Tax=Adineta steineri TaxID=433720 RepID=A0A819R9T2_9BILA|nr:unnamed protein product [Adineta steineri]
MTSLSVGIYDVDIQNYAYSSTGELGTKGLSPCVAVIILFSNRTVLIEHRSDHELYDEGDELDATYFFHDIVNSIAKKWKKKI